MLVKFPTSFMAGSKLTWLQCRSYLTFFNFNCLISVYIVICGWIRNYPFKQICGLDFPYASFYEKQIKNLKRA